MVGKPDMFWAVRADKILGCTSPYRYNQYCSRFGVNNCPDKKITPYQNNIIGISLLRPDWVWVMAGLLYAWGCLIRTGASGRFRPEQGAVKLGYLD